MSEPTETTTRHAPAHSCAACPVEVRGLYATADNAVRAFQAALDGTGSAERTVRKIEELRRAVADIQPLIDVHFAATKGIPGP